MYFSISYCGDGDLEALNNNFVVPLNLLYLLPCLMDLCMPLAIRGPRLTYNFLPKFSAPMTLRPSQKEKTIRDN